MIELSSTITGLGSTNELNMTLILSKLILNPTRLEETLRLCSTSDNSSSYNKTNKTSESYLVERTEFGHQNG